jgi:serine/threonine protein kinase
MIRVVRALNLQRYRYEDFRREENLGEGATYVVEKCVARGESIFAVKHLKVSSDKMFHARLRSVILEVQIMRHPPFKAHPNIISCLGYGWTTKDNVIMPYIVLEYASLGTLREHIKQYVRHSEVWLWEVEILLGDIVSGLAALHVCGIVHGDMKLDNVLVFPSTDRRGRALVKIADFGHALVLNDASTSPGRTSPVYTGTRM